MTHPTLLFADRPVGSDADPLWEGHEIRAHLEHVADTFVAPLLNDREAPSITVAVHGAWGSGKSSALRILRDVALAKVRALAPPAAGPPAGAAGAPIASAGAPPAPAPAGASLAERLVFCEYAAPVWQSAPIEPRTTLVARMLVSLAGGVERAVEEMFLTAKAAGSSAPGGTSQPPDAEGRFAWSSAALPQIAAVLSRLQDFDALLCGKIRDGRRVLVVLVDDLDRCDPSFVRELLDELQQLGGVPNLFFVLAADEATLRRAVRDEGTHGRPRTELDTDHELAKLVQHTVAVPPLDEGGAARLLHHLFPARDADPMASALVDNAELFFQGLPEQTPRAVKRCLNALGHRLRGELSKPGLTPIDRKRRIKEALLEHTWGDFYRACFVPMQSSTGRDREPLLSLQGVWQRAEYGGGGERRVAHELTFLRDEFPAVPWRDLPARLVRFLGTEPLLVGLSPSIAPAQHAVEAQPPGQPGGGFESDYTPQDDFLIVDPTAGEGPEIFASPGSRPITSPGDVLAVALVAVRAASVPRARLEGAAQAVLDLARFEPGSDGAAMTLARGLVPELARAPGDGALLAAVLDRYIALLRRCGLLRLACEVLHATYEVAGHVAYVRDAYASYLVGAGALEAARQVGANRKVVYREVLRDDPAGEKLFTANDESVRALLDAVLAAAPIT